MGGFRAQAEYVVWETKGAMDQEAAKAVGVLPGVLRFPISKAEKKHHTTHETKCKDFSDFRGRSLRSVAARIARICKIVDAQ
jgi:hypothetical protein